MAAVDPSESPTQQRSPAAEGETSGEKAEAAEPGCSLTDKDEPTCGETAQSPGDEQADSVGSDGARTASHSGVSVGSGAGAEKTTCNSQGDLTSAVNMAEAPGGEQRAFDWSETEDDDGKTRTRRGITKCDPSNIEEPVEVVQCNSHAGDTIADAHASCEEECSQSNKKEAEAPVAQVSVGSVNGLEVVAKAEEESGRGQDAGSTAKQKHCRLVCKECGKRFTRREMFNLHRHFHAHEDELTPLTCKQCGLTFQHRSSLIKHRNEHKAKKEELLTPNNEMQNKEVGSFECAECERTFSTVDKLRNHNCSNIVEKPYHCPLCRQEFQFKLSVTKHMMTHSQESLLTCQVCSQTFPNNMALRYHQRCHTALKPYECPECGMVFKHYSVMEDHRRRHTDSTRSHLCNICGKTFKYSSLLHQHQYLHTGQKPFRCPECGKTFAFAQNMKAHCRQHRLHNTSFTSEQPADKQSPVSVQEAARGPRKENTHQSKQPMRTFNCPLCPQTFNAPANLRAHMLIHEAEYEMLERTPQAPKEIHKYWEKSYTCPHCPHVCHDESSLNVHILSVHKSVPKYLEKVAAPPKNQFSPFSSDNVPEKLRRDDASVKSYKCSECGKTFRHRSVLELHMRIHSRDKPYQCKVCGKGFRFSSYLQQHVIIHTGKKPYKCPDCGKDFAFMQNMRTHQKLHREKPFRCTSCRKGYSDQSQLQQHMLSHNGDKPHKCDMCDKSFGLAYLLRDHMNTHTGERPHRCDECHKSFSWFSSLIVHQKIHARKRQSFSQYNSLSNSTRMRGRGSRGRRGARGGRGGKFMWGWSRPLGGSGVDPQLSPYPGSAVREAELHKRAIQSQSSMLSPRMDLKSTQHKEPWLSELHPQPVQWKVDGGEVMPVPSMLHQNAAPQFESPSQTGLQQHQRSPGWTDSPSVSQSESLESTHMKDGTACVSSHLVSVPKKSSPLAVMDIEKHRQPKPVTWNSTSTSTVLASTSSLQQEFSGPSSYIDGAALWSIRPAQLTNSGSPNKLGQEIQLPRWSGVPVSTHKEPSTPPKKEDRSWELNNPQVKLSTVSQPEKQWASGLAGASTSAQIDQSSAIPVSAPVSHGGGNTLWDIQTPSGIPKTINSSEKLVNNQDFQLQQKQVSSGWTTVPSQASTQKIPISIQYEAHRFGQGMATPVWGFQSNPVGPQTLLTGQLKPGNGKDLQQQPIVMGTQILINQPSPFFSPPLAPLPPLALPGPHPLHTVAVGALPRPPHPNIFFTSQAVMSERPHMPQTLPLPQLAPRTEPHKLGPRLPFVPERLLQCMICGCSLPRELDLQMHYLQHAQGEI